MISRFLSSSCTVHLYLAKVLLFDVPVCWPHPKLWMPLTCTASPLGCGNKRGAHWRGRTSACGIRGHSWSTCTASRPVLVGRWLVPSTGLVMMVPKIPRLFLQMESAKIMQECVIELLILSLLHKVEENVILTYRQKPAKYFCLLSCMLDFK